MNKYLCLIACVLCTFCTPKTNNVTYEPIDTTNAVQLSATMIGEPLMSSPVIDLVEVGDYLVALAFKDNKMCHIYTKQGVPVSSFCAQGRGPGEVIQVNSISKKPNSSEVVVLDGVSNKYVVYNIDSIATGSVAAKNGIEYKIEMQPIFTNVAKVVLLPKDHILYEGQAGLLSNRAPSRYGLVDKTNKLTSSYSKYPISEDTMAMRLSYNPSRLSVTPDGSKMVCSNSIGAILETFDLNGKIEVRATSYIIEPLFKYNGVTITDHSNIVWGFNDIYAADDFVVTAYNGEVFSSLYAPSKIVIFDWQAKPTKVYQTDFANRQIIYSRSDNAIYSAIEEKENGPRLARYQL